MKTTEIPKVGYVLISRKEPFCQSCETLENLLIRLDVEFVKIDVVTLGVARMSVPQLYKDGNLLFEGIIPDVEKIKRMFQSV